ncbi:hypothetical protein NHX12_005257 [Muraenolepis orangiensis]|uniref:Uncharacterized protein n=1 Tax=Muraenolepis orangiensis TaxID=630683 RepID=A0A9Q0DR09_9TELE|nr:hypothetical protein NHX12_005257 [Muraenolepis orangiensis]
MTALRQRKSSRAKEPPLGTDFQKPLKNDCCPEHHTEGKWGAGWLASRCSPKPYPSVHRPPRSPPAPLPPNTFQSVWLCEDPRSAAESDEQCTATHFTGWRSWDGSLPIAWPASGPMGPRKIVKPCQPDVASYPLMHPGLRRQQ